jgi:hypothetical protein
MWNLKSLLNGEEYEELLLTSNIRHGRVGMQHRAPMIGICATVPSQYCECSNRLFGPGNWR